MIKRWKKFHGLNPSGDSKLCDHFAMVTWEFFVGIAPGRNLPYEVFFVQLWYMCVLNEKNLNALWVPAILQAFEVDQFWRFWPKSPFLGKDSSRTRHSKYKIESKSYIVSIHFPVPCFNKPKGCGLRVAGWKWLQTNIM